MTSQHRKGFVSIPYSMGLGRAAAEFAKAGWAPPNPGQTLGELSNPAALSTAPHQAPSPPVGDGITFTSSPSDNQIFAGYVTSLISSPSLGSQQHKRGIAPSHILRLPASCSPVWKSCSDSYSLPRRSSSSAAKPCWNLDEKSLHNREK